MARLSLLFLLFGAAVLHGDRNQEINLEFGVFCPFPPSPSGVYYRNGEQVHEVKFHRHVTGTRFTYRGPNPMVFYVQEEIEGEMEMIPVASVYIEADMAEPFLIFTQGRSSEEDVRYNVMAMDVDPSAFPSGAITLVNLSGATMEGLIGNIRSVIRPGVSEPFQMQNGGTFRLGLAIDFQDRVYPTFLNTVTLDSRTRQWMFIAPPRREGSMRVRVRFVEDHGLFATPQET